MIIELNQIEHTNHTQIDKMIGIDECIRIDCNLLHLTKVNKLVALTLNTKRFVADFPFNFVQLILKPFQFLVISFSNIVDLCWIL